MRIDKYLWATRYYKTRNQATEACKKGHIKIAGNKVKPAKEVFIGEHVTVRKNQINYELEVLDVPPNRIGAKLVDLYRKDVTPKEAFADQELLRMAKDHYRLKGEGRPTKKERRDLDDYASNIDDV